MDAWSLTKARPISCNDCPTFQRHHMSIRWFAESFTLLLNLINTTFREKIYTRWCCIDRLSWQGLSECGFRSHRRSAVWRPLTDEEKAIALEAQTNTSTSGSRSRQNCRLKFPRLARFRTFISICHRRLHCLVLLRTKARFQQNRCSPLPFTTRSSPPICLHDQCAPRC